MSGLPLHVAFRLHGQGLLGKQSSWDKVRATKGMCGLELLTVQNEGTFSTDETNRPPTPKRACAILGKKTGKQNKTKMTL